VPHPPEYVPRDHVPVFVPEFEHPEDLVPAEGTPPLLPISTPSTSCRAGIPEANTPPRNMPLLATPRPGCEVEESSAAAARRQGPAMAHGTRLRDTERRMMAALELVNRRVSYQVDVCTRESSEFCTRHHDAQKDRAAVRAEIEVLRNERLAYEQEGIQTREALTRSEAHCKALEARVAVLETHARHLEWQRQAADDFVVEHIMRTQALEARARDDTLEDTDSNTIMSDFEDSTVTCTTVSSPYEGRSGDVSPGEDGLPVMPEDPYAYVVAAFQALPPSDYDEVFLAEEQPLPAAALPTADSPGYIPESDLDEDLEEDDDEDPNDDNEEEEHPASADSIPPSPALRVTARISFRPQPLTLSFTEKDAKRFLAMPIPPPSPLTLLSYPLPQIPFPPLPVSPSILPIPLPAASPPLRLLSSDRRADRPEVTLPPQKRLSIVHCLGYEAGESLVAAAARPIKGHRADYGFVDSETRCSREAWAHSIGHSSAVYFELQGYMTHTWVQDQRIDAHDTLIATLTTQLSSLQGHLATALGKI
nr:hypothetical protein [Tanacetum cinerariifolium]